METHKHTKKFGIYYWDTFEPAGHGTFLIGEVDTFDEAEEFIHDHCRGRLGPRGADYAEIVDNKGNVLKRYSIS